MDFVKELQEISGELTLGANLLVTTGRSRVMIRVLFNASRGGVLLFVMHE